MSLSKLYDWYRQTVRNPKYRWWIVAATIAYLVSPIDLAPDLIPIAGQLDDLAIVTLLVAELSQIAIDWFKTKQQVSARANRSPQGDTQNTAYYSGSSAAGSGSDGETLDATAVRLD